MSTKAWCDQKTGSKGLWNEPMVPLTAPWIQLWPPWRSSSWRKPLPALALNAYWPSPKSTLAASVVSSIITRWRSCVAGGPLPAGSVVMAPRTTGDALFAYFQPAPPSWPAVVAVLKAVPAAQPQPAAPWPPVVPKPSVVKMASVLVPS